MKRIGTVGVVALVLSMFGFAGRHRRWHPATMTSVRRRSSSSGPIPTGRTRRPRPRQARRIPPTVSPRRRIVRRSGTSSRRSRSSGRRRHAGRLRHDPVRRHAQRLGRDRCHRLQRRCLRPAVCGRLGRPSSTTYLLIVGTSCGGGVVGEAGGGGSLVFYLDLAPPPPTIDLTIDARGPFNKAGSAIIGGTIACTNASGFAAEVQASQRVAGSSSGVSGSSTGNARKSRRPVGRGVRRERQVRHRSTPVVVFANACGPLECAEASVSRRCASSGECVVRLLFPLRVIVLYALLVARVRRLVLPPRSSPRPSSTCSRRAPSRLFSVARRPPTAPGRALRRPTSRASGTPARADDSSSPCSSDSRASSS